MSNRSICILCGTLVLFLIALLPLEGQAALGGVEMVSVNSAEVQATNLSGNAAISGDGRYVVFHSVAQNLSSQFDNFMDVYRRDRVAGVTVRVSVDNTGSDPNNASQNPAISSDGRFVAFDSNASDLLPGGGDSNGYTDVFIRDMDSNITTRVSVSGTGVQGNYTSSNPSISCDGRFVAFQSLATNLVANDTNGYTQDIFVRDRLANTTALISLDPTESAFVGDSSNPDISCDGRFVVWKTYMGAPSYLYQVFVRDLTLGSTTMVSVNDGGGEGNNNSENPSINANGRFVAFSSYATNFVLWPAGYPGLGYSNIFIRDLQMGTTRQVSVTSVETPVDAHHYNPSISGNGRYVAFESTATNLVLGDLNNTSDIFVRDRWRGETYRVNLSNSGEQANDDSNQPRISRDGRYVAFQSLAFNLTVENNPGPNYQDIFVKQPRYSRQAIYDFDGDGKTDIAIYRSSIGYWGALGSSDGGYIQESWGTPEDIKVPGDYDGDGKTDVAVFRPSAGIWFIIRSHDGGITSTSWGINGDIPVPGDYDGDGNTDIAVFRPSTRTWSILYSSEGAAGYIEWGIPGDEPITGQN